MGSGKNITKETMIKAYKLNKKIDDIGLIAETLGISSASVHRIIDIMTTAGRGGNVDELFKESYPTLKRYAKEYFGINKQPKEEVAADKTKQTINEGVYLVRILEHLDRQTELLEKLCSAWGVEE